MLATRPRPAARAGTRRQNLTEVEEELHRAAAGAEGVGRWEQQAGGAEHGGLKPVLNTPAYDDARGGRAPRR